MIHYIILAVVLFTLLSLAVFKLRKRKEAKRPASDELDRAMEELAAAIHKWDPKPPTELVVSVDGCDTAVLAQDNDTILDVSNS